MSINPDVAYRRILLGKAAVKIKLAALQAMTKPSERLLVQLVRSADTHPRIRLLAADLLKQRQEKKAVDRLLQSLKGQNGQS